MDEEGKMSALRREINTMMKKWISLFLVAAMLLSLVPSALAAGDLNSYAKGSFSQGYDVYTGPGTHYHRIDGNAHYGSGSCRIYGTVGDWLLIGYGGKNNSYHIGYIPKEALDYVQNLNGTVGELTFDNIQDTIIEGGCNLTDDPVIHNTRFTTLSGGTPVTILGYMGGWTYIETQMKNGDIARGFVRSFHVNSGVDKKAESTKKPESTQAPAATQKPQATEKPNIQGKESLLSSLVHNCPNTGIMLPGAFSPYESTYLLTVASWVSRVTFTPTSYDPDARITVNGQKVRSGEKSQIIQMTNDPQAVSIQVRGSNGVESTYTVFLQRRPSTARTRVSVGYIDDIYQKSNEYYISADLVTVEYQSDDYETGSRSTIYNDSSYLYKYVVDPNCAYYCGTTENATRAADIHAFTEAWKQDKNALYTIVYMADEIVAVMPYSEYR